MPSETTFSTNFASVAPDQPADFRSGLERLSVESRVPANILAAMAEAHGAPDDATKLKVAQQVAKNIAPRLAAGEDIEKIILDGSKDEQLGRQFLERARLLGAEMYPDRIKKDAFEGEGLVATAKRRGQQFVGGLVEPFASLPEAAAIAEAQTDGDEDAAGDTAAFKAGERIREGAEGIVGEADWRDNGFWGALAQGAGNMVGMAGATLGAGIATGPVGAIATGAGLGSAMGASQAYREAREAGASEDAAELAARWGGGIGLTEVVPIARALDIIPSKLRTDIANAVGDRAGQILQSSGEEAAQEFLATTAQNIVAQQIYDPERGWTEGAGQGALIGAILGGGVGAVGSFLPGGQPDEAPDLGIPPEPEPTPDAPLGLPAPAMVTPPPGKEGQRALPPPSDFGGAPGIVAPPPSPLPPAPGSMAEAMQIAPDPVGAAAGGQMVTLHMGSIKVVGRLAKDDGVSVDIIEDETGEVFTVPREQIDNDVVRLVPRDDETAITEAADPSSSLSQAAAERITAPLSDGMRNDEPQTAEEALRRAAVIEDHAAANGWSTRLKETHEALKELAATLGEAAPEAEMKPAKLPAPEPQPALIAPAPQPEPAISQPDRADAQPETPEVQPDALDVVTKKDGTPFGNEAAAKRGVKARKLDPEAFDYQERDGGIVAVPRAEGVEPDLDTPNGGTDEDVSAPAVATPDEDGSASGGPAGGAGDARLEPLPDPTPAPEGRGAQMEGEKPVLERPRDPVKPMPAPDARIQPDMFGGADVSETQMAAKEKSAREWGQFLAIASAGKTKEWDGELEGHDVSVRDGSQIEITPFFAAGPGGQTESVSRDVDGMSRTEIAKWAKGVVDRNLAAAGYAQKEAEAAERAANEAAAESAQPAPEAPADFVTVKDVYGEKHRVKQSDLDSDRSMVGRYNAKGERLEGPLLNRENIDADGTGAAATYAEDPYFTKKDGKPFADEATARRALVERFRQDPEEFDFDKVDGGVVPVRRSAKKADATTPATAPEPEPEAGPAPAPEGPRTAFKLADRLSEPNKKALAKHRDENVGDIVGDLDAAARRAEAQRRANPSSRQAAQLVDEAAILSDQILDAARKAKTGDLEWSNRDEETGEYDFETGHPAMAEALQWLDTFEAMGTWTDTVDPSMADGYDGTATPERMDDADLFPAPAGKTANLDAASKKAGFLSIEEGRARVDGWKAVADEIGKTGANARKVIVSLFDYTGAWSEPWERAGYQVIRHDIKTGSDLLTDQWVFDQIEEHRQSGFEIHGVLSACPCTTFAGSGARWWKERHDVESREALETVFGERATWTDAKSPIDYNLKLVEATREVVRLANPTAFHVLENPVGRIQKAAGLNDPLLRFNPNNFGDPYTKYTQIFGAGKSDLPLAPVDPVDGSKMQSQYRGDDPIGKEARSTTPEGFAYAWFMANDPEARKRIEGGSTVDSAAAEAAPNPTDAQKEAGNYKKGHVRLHGLDISIETAKGEARTGKGPDGKEWSVTMPAHYGDIRGTVGADGDPIDVYIGDKPDSDYVVMVMQVDPDTGIFDEIKVILGTETRQDAMDLYRAGFSDGRANERIGAFDTTDVEHLKSWIAAGGGQSPTAPLDFPYLEGRKRRAALNGAQQNAGMKPSPRKERGDPAPVSETTNAEAAETILKADGSSFATQDSARAALVRKNLPLNEWEIAPQDGGFIARPRTVGNGPQTTVPAPAPAAAPAPKAKPADYGAGNTLVSQDRADELRARLRQKLKNQLSAGIDPEIMAIGAELAVFHIEAGSRRFLDLARAIADDLGTTPEKLKPYLRSWYNGARDMMEDNDISVDGMDDAATVGNIVKSGGLDAGNSTGTTPNDMEGQPSPDGVASDERDLVQDGEREARGDDASGLEDGARPDRALAPEQPEDGEATGSGEGARGDGPRSGRSDAGGGEGVPEGGDGADGRAGAGGTGVPDEGTGDRREPGSESTRSNFVIRDPEAVMGGTPMVRFKRNQKAIEAFNDITAEGRAPTPDELDAMAGYTGWGSFGQELFQGSWDQPRPKEGWEKRDEWLRDQLGEEAWKSAQGSIINAHYTDPPTVQAMWAMAERMGFNGGRVLEPSMGIGNFFGLMPEGLAQKSSLTGIELDRTTGGMSQILYPEAQIAVKGYETSRTPDGFYDLVIGNWPFASQGPADRRYNKLNPSLHDYFFLKALDQTRPGGIVIGVTSSGTMDKKGTATRDALARKADLVASFRLPTGAFEKYAGTKVVTDIIILKKRAEPRFDVRDVDWINLTEIDTPSGQKIEVNSYYAARPENVLGTHNFGSGTTRGRAGMIVDRPDDLAERLAALPGRVPEGAFEPVKRGGEERFLTNSADDRTGSVVVKDGDLWSAQGERLVPLDTVAKWRIKDQKKTDKRRDAIERLVELRRAYGAVVDAERDGKPDTETRRKALAKQYAAYRKAHGTIQDGDAIKTLQKAGDPAVPMLLAIERTDGSPSDILTKPLVRAAQSLDNPSIPGAYVMARNESPTLDLDRVAELAKVDRAEVEKELLARKAIYRMPGGAFEIGDLFLSGNVRRRLRALEDARDDGETGLEESIAAIKAVVPEDIPYYKIDANMGAVWTGPDVYRDFMAEILGLSEAQTGSVTLNFVAGTWKLKIEDRGILAKPEATTTHGIQHTGFDRIFRAALNNETMKLQSKDEHGNKFVDQEKSKEANEKIEKLRETFKDWVWTDPDRRVALAATYNDAMNAIADASFDGSFLDFPGMTLRRGDDPFSLRSHQANAIWRGIAKGSGLYAHEVGTGKTYTMGGIAIESRRYGIARKPMIVAHNANSATVAAEINEMYPGAKILYVGSLGKDDVKRTLYSIRNDDWDAVVIPHSLIDRMALSQDTLEAMVAEDIAALETAALEAAEEDGADLSLADMDDDEAIKKLRSVTAKELVKARNAIKARVEKNAQRAAKEDAVTFEDLGVDMLLIDEIHEFKKPTFVTKMQMKGLQKSTSQRSIQLQFLTRYVKQLRGGKGIHAFTGTPITNTLTEMFHQMRYVMEGAMSEASVSEWDGWFNTFAQAEADLEIASDGQFETVTRLSSFVNVAELRRMAGEYLDIVMADEMPEFVPRQTSIGKTMADKLNDEEMAELRNGRTENPIGRPYKKIVNETAPMNEVQERIQRDLAARYDRFRKSSPKERAKIIKGKAGTPEWEINPLNISLEADATAFDIRLRNPQREDLPDSKVNRMIGRAMEHYRESPLATQVIFMDKGHENFGTEAGERVERMNISNDIRDKLIAQGVKPSEIAIVKGSTSKERRKAIALQMNAAELRFVIGGTSTLGVGVNMQKNLRAMHHLDAPWMPGELEQRNGRGQRQGNAWNTVMEYRYMTERLDAKRWQTLAKKQRFITDFMRADMDTRIIEGDAVDDSESVSGDDIAESLSDAAGDPRIFQLSKAKMQIDKLDRRRSTHEAGAVDAGRQASRIEKRLEASRDELGKLRADEKHVAGLRDSETFSAEIDGKSFTDKKEADAAFAAYMEKWRVPAQALDGYVAMPVKVQGFTLKVHDGFRGNSFIMEREATHSVGKASLASMEANMRRIGKDARDLAEDIESQEASIKRLRAAAKEPFAQLDALEQKKVQAAALEADMEANPIPAPTWLRQGTPTDTKIMVKGEAHIVVGHRWGPDDYFVLTDKGDVPYLDARGEDGAPIYDEVDWKRPPEAAEREGEAAAPKEFRGPAAPPLDNSAITDAVRAARGELEKIGIGHRVAVRFARSKPILQRLSGYTQAAYYEPTAGSGDAGRIVLREGENWRGLLDHEIIHALRDPELWGGDYGLFTAAEWRGLVRQARASKAISARVRRTYPDLTPRDQSEEMVAELYREWAAARRPAGVMAEAFHKIRDFLRALASGFRSTGHEQAAQVFERIASGEVGSRDPQGPGGGARRARRESRADPMASSFSPTERKRVSQILSDAMGGKVGLLALVPGRPLFAELGRKLPSAATYLRLKESMDAERQEWHSRTDETAQEWRKLIAKHGEANKRLMDIMHRATLSGVDPSQPFLTKRTPQDDQLLRQSPKTYAHQSAKARLKEDQQRQGEYRSLKAEFDRLPPELRQMFSQVRDRYTTLADAFDDAVIDNVAKSIDIAVERAERDHKRELRRIKDEGLTGKERLEAIAEADERLDSARRRGGKGKASRINALRARFETNRLDGPYFPLSRWGDYFATVRDRAGRVVSFSRFESETDQAAFAKEHRAVDGQTVEIGVLDDAGGLRDQVDPGFVADIEKILGDALSDDKLMDDIWQRWLETLPDFSIRTQRIHRKGTAGYDTDAFRSFGRTMFHGSHQLARLRYSTDMQAALERTRDEARTSDDPNRNGMIANEMARRHDFTMNPTGSAWAQAATSAAFTYYLGVTPAAALVNISQTTVVGIPVLSAGFKGATMGQATKQLTRAMRDFAQGKGSVETSDRLTAEERAAIKEAYARGTIDKTQSHDLAGVAETGVEYSATRVKIMEKISYLFHHAERLNREVTFLAAYRMARSHGLSGGAAIDRAADLTWKTHFDYQNTSRPRALQNDAAKVLLVFRNFQINMLWRLFRDLHQSVKGESAEVRAEARAQLIGVTAMMMLHAGITGTWGYALITTLLGLFFDDGKDDVEEGLQRTLVELFGPNIAGMMLKGVPGHLTGIDLTSRLGMPELWFRSSDRQLEGDDVYNYWLAELVGPVPGMAENLVRGIQKVGEGEVWRGLETVAPKFLRDLMQAGRYASEGVQTYNGDPILGDVSPYQVLTEALGFSPAEVSERYDANTKLKNREKRLQDERRGVMRLATDDLKEGQGISEKARRRIAEWNKENPTYPITGDSIRQSLRGRLRASERNEGGIVLNARLDQRLREEAAPGIYF